MGTSCTSCLRIAFSKSMRFGGIERVCGFYALTCLFVILRMLCNHRSLLSFVSPLFRSWHQIYSATQPASPFRSISLHAVEAEQGAASHKKGGSSLGMCSEVTASRGGSIRTSLLRHSQGVGTTCRAKTSLLPKCDRQQFSFKIPALAIQTHNYT